MDVSVDVSYTPDHGECGAKGTESSTLYRSPAPPASEQVFVLGPGRSAVKRVSRTSAGEPA